MIRPKDRDRSIQLSERLSAFSRRNTELKGIGNEERLKTLVAQIIESEHRIDYIRVIRNRYKSQDVKDPQSPAFNPLKAALLFHQEGNIDEAFWLVFLSVHFGCHDQSKWRLTALIYGGLGTTWTWARLSNDLPAFNTWYQENAAMLIEAKQDMKFGGHRKYESLKLNAKRSIPEIFSSYVNWVGVNYGHHNHFANFTNSSQADPEEAFDQAFISMKEEVVSFSRLSIFDYLTMLAKLGFVQIRPQHPYLKGATGPLRGARLLVDNDPTSKTHWSNLNELLADLGRHLEIGMQEVEDSLYNWQKSPDSFIPFRG